MDKLELKTCIKATGVCPPQKRAKSKSHKKVMQGNVNSAVTCDEKCPKLCASGLYMVYKMDLTACARVMVISAE